MNNKRTIRRELNPLIKTKPKHFSTVGRLRIAEIQRIVEENPSVQTLSFHDELCEKGTPGQFVMVWIPGIDEVPMSLSTIEGDHCSFTVAKVGEATKALHRMKEGDLIGVRGPFGKGFSYVKGEVLIVGGGTGVSPLAVLAENLSRLGAEVTFLLGAKTKIELLFLDRVNKVSVNVIATTDDGSFGLKGFVTESAERMLTDKKFDVVYACGPEPMMVKMLSLAEKYSVPLQVSLERLMRCAVGLCGSCVIGIYRVCKDGPVFIGRQLEEVKEEFGRLRRDFDGRKIAV
jgi:dihydroorotate dehydrogenase electron transfer subunit